MAFQFPKQKVTNEIFNYVQGSYLSRIILYFINSSYCTAVNLSDWISSFDLAMLDDVLNEIPDSDSYDEQVRLKLCEVKI